MRHSVSHNFFFFLIFLKLNYLLNWKATLSPRSGIAPSAQTLLYYRKSHLSVKSLSVQLVVLPLALGKRNPDRNPLHMPFIENLFFFPVQVSLSNTILR